ADASHSDYSILLNLLTNALKQTFPPDHPMCSGELMRFLLVGALLLPILAIDHPQSKEPKKEEKKTEQSKTVPDRVERKKERQQERNKELDRRLNPPKK